MIRLLSSLAGGAEISPSAAQAQTLNNAATAKAGKSLTVINFQFMLILTLLAKQIAPIRYSCTPAGNGFLKYLFRRSLNLPPLPQGYSAYWSPRTHGYFMENLTGINVSNAGNQSLIHQK